MTILTVHIDNKKNEKAIKAVLDALGLDYNLSQEKNGSQLLNKSEELIYNRLKRSAEEIRLYKEGKIVLQDASEFLNEI